MYYSLITILTLPKIISKLITADWFTIYECSLILNEKIVDSKIPDVPNVFNKYQAFMRWKQQSSQSLIYLDYNDKVEKLENVWTRHGAYELMTGVCKTSLNIKSKNSHLYLKDTCRFFPGIQTPIIY